MGRFSAFSQVRGCSRAPGRDYRRVRLGKVVGADGEGGFCSCEDMRWIAKPPPITKSHPAEPAKIMALPILFTAPPLHPMAQLPSQDRRVTMNTTAKVIK